MKRILFILFLIISFQSFGQNRFPTIDSLQNYILRYVRNSTVESFTNLRLQNTIYGLSEFIDSLAGNGAVDSIWIVDAATDTLKYRKQGVTYVVGAISGGGSGSQSLDDVLTVGNFSTNSVRARFQVRNSANTVTLGDWFNNANTTSELYIYNTSGQQALLTYNNLEFKATGSNYQSIRPHSSPSAAYTTFNLPNTAAVQRYFPMTFKLNGTTVAAGDTGLVDLGTVTGGVPYTLINGATNLGSGAQVFKDTSSNKINLRSIVQGWNTKVTQNTNDITISVDTTTQTLTDGATVTFDANAGVSARVTLGGNRTLAFSNFRNGMFLSLLIIQDGTGGRTITLPTSKVINGGAGAVTLTTAASSHDILTFWKINDVIYCNYGKNYN